MQSYSLHRLTTVLCTVCLAQLVITGPSLAGEPSSSAKLSGLARKGPPPAGSEADWQAIDSPVKVASATGTDNQVAKQGPAAGTPTVTKNPSSAQAETGGFWGWFNKPSVREVMSRFAPAFTFYYARSIADYDSSDFSHSLGFVGGLDYAVTPSLVVSTELTLYQELGEEYERFVLSNWFFGATKTFQLPYAGVLYPRFFFQLPTNPDDREYLTYRGTVGADVELRKFNFYKFHKDHAIGGSIGFGALRNFYAKTASDAGWPNRLWRVTGMAALNYKFRDFLMFIVKFKNHWYLYPEGNRANDVYQLSAAINYSPINQLWLALAAYSTNRTFLYDQTSVNVALWSPEDTSVIFSMTYLPRISKTHELNR